MNRKPSHVLAAITAVIMAIAGAVNSTVGAEPGEVSSGGMHLIASVDTSSVKSTGDLAMGVPFSHSAKVAGNFSATLSGASAMRSGLIIAGYLVGCAVDVSDGINVSIGATSGVNVDFVPGLLGLTLEGPLGVNIGGEVIFGVFGQVGAELTVNLAPGSVAAAVIAESELDEKSSFPFTFAHSNTSLNINGCLTPASAMPFITVRAAASNGIVQTTGYGDSFAF